MEQPIGLSGLRPMQPRFNRIEVGLPHMKASLQSYNSSPTFNSPKIKHYYKPFQTLVDIYKYCFKTTSYASLWGVTAEEKLSCDYTRRES
jgi:hypothetical protein